MEQINLHFTGDFHAISSANNLLAALIDNHIYHGNKLDIDARRVSWGRTVDMNDRSLRDIVDRRSAASANGYPRQSKFDILGRLRGDGRLLPRHQSSPTCRSG